MPGDEGPKELLEGVQRAVQTTICISYSGRNTADDADNSHHGGGPGGCSAPFRVSTDLGDPLTDPRN